MESPLDESNILSCFGFLVGLILAGLNLKMIMIRTVKSKIPNKKIETEETTRVMTSRFSSFAILCSLFTQ
jgi:hypothetical protein